ncbi:hypothetical protein HPDFL43_05740 [Hoeflea phototrophica DFL-43]|jgi:hypothetical protein|uniref:Uncharacterized protein n=1 Tax=Hoeflea phototrophica (strain DSM 17068 / NCIMB 14078 / DFL-43) TaxID=411684 RepID=A9D4P9_HOEPD|nr:hypothetical protein [Hoeflea phototrophica]EDQ33931.1 hypothetical protein HPDFL43_05740 [Hoeflea phototrophica DFL-43]
MNAGLGSSWFVGPFPHIAAVEPVGSFGSPEAIAPHFAALPMAERQSAVLMMRELGLGDGPIAAAVDLPVDDVARLATRCCPPVGIKGDPDDTRGSRTALLLKRPVDSAAVDRTLDDALLTIDALRVAAGAGPDAGFELTNGELCQAMGFGIETARRRMQALETRGLIARTLRPGQHQLVVVTPVGHRRLSILNRRAAQ